MKFRFLLWINSLVFFAYLIGHLFDIFYIVPNWKSGSIEDIARYNAFFQHADPRNFFSQVRPVSIALSFICLVLFWAKGSPIRTFLIISLMIDILIYVITYFYFTPINDYLFLNETSSMIPDIVKQDASKWIGANYMRIAMISIGFFTSLQAVHYSYASRYRMS